jgi:hypothetical protein
MELNRYSVFLVAILVIAVLFAGCTTTTTTTVGSPTGAPSAAQTGTAAAAPVTTTAAIAGVSTAAPVAAATTPACPDKLVWNGKWDTRWVVEGHDVMDQAKSWIEGKDDGLGPGPTPFTLSQNCWDVTGTYKDGGSDTLGTITAKGDGNQLKGTYHWKAPTPDGDVYGTFTVTMAADNKSFVGYIRSHDRGDYGDPNNWYAKKSS